MIVITLYLTNLFIAPQLWIEAFKGIRVDFIILPLWLGVVAFKGRLPDLFRFKVIDWFFVAMLVWIVLASILNTTNDKTFDLIADYVKFFTLYRLFAVTIQTMPELRKVLWIFLFFVMVLVVEGIQQKLSPDGVGWAGQTLGWVDPSVLAAGGTGRTRWINLFDGPGVFCVVFTIGLPIVLILLGPPFGIVMRVLGFAMLGPLLIATYFTGSRGGLIAALAIIALYLMIRLRVSVTKVAIVCGLVVVAYMAAPSHLTGVKDESHSAQHRVEMWAEGVEMVTSHPLFGVGKGNFRIYTSALIAHNSAIEIMGETGIPGLFFWISLIYLAVKGLILYRVGPYNEVDKAYVTALALIILGYIMSSMFVTLEYETLYILLGLCAVVGNHLNEQVQFNRRDFKVTASVSILWIVLVKAFAMVYF